MATRIRRLLAGLLLAAACLTAAATAGTGATMTVATSDAHAGARNVRLTLELRYEMQCNYPGAAPAVLTLPGHVPGTIIASAVLVNGKSARGVSVDGQELTIAQPRAPEILCDLIGTGTLTIVLTPRAGIGNPPKAGHYHVTARKGQLTFSAPLTITAA